MKFHIGEYEIEELHCEDDAEKAKRIETAEQFKDAKVKEQVLTFLTNRDKNMVRYVIRLNGNVIGDITFSGENIKHPEIGIEIAEDHRIKGIGYFLLRELMSRVSEMNGVEYFVYSVRNDNQASIKLAEKLGGKLHKTLRPVPNFDLAIHTFHIAIKKI